MVLEQSAHQPSPRDLLAKGRVSFRAGRYLEALNQFEILRISALSARDYRLAARATGNVGGCRFALRRYQAALQSFLEARRLATIAGDASAIAVFDANIASLYSETGQLDAAAEWIEGCLDRIAGKDRKAHLPQLLLQIATIRARQGRMTEALDLFRRGIDAADGAGDLELYALGWNRLGEEFLKRRDLPAAERALGEAFRLRKLNHLALDSSYRNLGRLRLAQGDLASASALLDRAVELAAGQRGLMPAWDIYHSRGVVRLAQGRLPEALGDLRIAVRLARAWRWSAPADDAARIGAEGWLESVHSALIEAGNRLYLETGDRALLRETFEAAEENRSSSLRALLNRGAAEELPGAYWEALGRLQRAEIEALRGGSAGGQALRAARAELIRMEASLGPAWAPPSDDVTGRARAALGGDSVLLSFHLGAANSWLWALDRSGLALYRLPARAEIERDVEAAARSVRDDAPDAARAGARLYRTLFGTMAPRFRQKQRWLLALDDALFGAPLPALVEEGGGAAPVYVAQRHTTEVIPGAAYWLEARAATGAAPLSTAFVGVGDPIYNGADPRLRRRSRGTGPEWLERLISPPVSAASLTLPRLTGSGAEVESCARAWQGERVLLEGAAASRRNVIRSLARRPEVVHFATHVLESQGVRTSGLIALSLGESGEPELLTPEDIGQWRIRAGLVVLSGCHSDAAAVLPGTGLAGLTRAWLAAGAQAVIGSRWEIPDDDGALFRALYRNLRERRGAGPGDSLRRAQVEMLRSGGWRARPRYWGAYFATGAE